MKKPKANNVDNGYASDYESDLNQINKYSIGKYVRKIKGIGSAEKCQIIKELPEK